jgi:hypothetical protein
MNLRFAPRSAPVFAFALALFAAAGGGSAFAQAASPAQGLLDDSLVMNLGIFVVQTDVTARLNGNSSTNPDIDFDHTFGKPKDSTRVRADALWRITPTHHLRFMYFNNDQTRAATLTQDVTWGDYTFPATSHLEANQKYSITALAYEYAFMRQPSYEIAGTFGIHYTDISLKLTGQTSVNNTPVQVTQEGSAPAPLPVIGVRGGWVVAPQWYIDAQAQFFKVNYNGINGSISDLRLGGTWMFSRHMGLGLGYNRFYTRVDMSKDTFNGSLKFGYSGLQAYLTGSF